MTNLDRDDLEQAAGAGANVGQAQAGGGAKPPTPVGKNRWPKDNQEALIAFYGTPKTARLESQLVDVVPPFAMTFTDDNGQTTPVRRIKFHRKCADALQAALQEIWEKCGRDQAKINALGIQRFDGSYNPRLIRGSTTKWSNHAFGAAIDLAAADNAMGTGHGKMPQIVIDAFKRQGARWGGDYKKRTDPMHFEFCGGGQAMEQPTPQHTARAAAGTSR
jgi:hypothetical protein